MTETAIRPENVTRHPQVPKGGTLTVGELRAALEGLDPGAPVLFESPFYGVFGSGQKYRLAGIEAVQLAEQSQVTPAGSYEDDETGERREYEAFEQIWDAWSGVVLKTPRYG